MSGIIVHEWLARTGGSENVFEAMMQAFPDAARYCLWNDSQGRFEDVQETALARTPLRRSKALALPFMPLAWRRLPAEDADWILCSSHVFAHHARFAGPAREAPKLVYAHTPARYVWVPELDGRGTGVAARAMSAALKPIDARRAKEPVAIAANSRFVAERIQDTWQREASVIYPPVDVQRILAPAPEPSADERATVATLPDEFVLAVSRFVPYKRLEAAVDVGVAVGMPVVLAGGGPDEGRLRALAERHADRVFIVSRPSFALLRELLHRAAVLVFAPIEDFGIVPVESMAAGTPTMVNAVGGAAESVIDGVTGAHVRDWNSPAELREAFERATRTKRHDLVARATEFDAPVFADRIRSFVGSSVAAVSPSPATLESGGAR